MVFLNSCHRDTFKYTYRLGYRFFTAVRLRCLYCIIIIYGPFQTLNWIEHWLFSTNESEIRTHYHTTLCVLLISLRFVSPQKKGIKHCMYLTLVDGVREQYPRPTTINNSVFSISPPLPLENILLWNLKSIEHAQSACWIFSANNRLMFIYFSWTVGSGLELRL